MLRAAHPYPGRTGQVDQVCCEGPVQPSRYPARNAHRQRAIAHRVRVKSFLCPSPFRERLNMRFPQVSERVKEAPANALRSVFASIGQVLLVTDRMKKKSGESEESSPEGTAVMATDKENSVTAEKPAVAEAAGSTAVAEAPVTGKVKA